MIRTPGNLNTSLGPSFPGTPPIAVQNVLAASTSGTKKCTWPMDTPALFGAATWAQEAWAGINIARPRIKSNFFIRMLLVPAESRDPPQFVPGRIRFLLLHDPLNR